MSLQKLIEKIKPKAEKDIDRFDRTAFKPEDILKLCLAAEVLWTSMNNTKKDLDDIDTSLMVDHGICKAGVSRTKLAITISQNQADQICGKE